MSGRCRFCRCTVMAPCPSGCYWLAADLCSECADIDRAWRERRVRPPNMVRAFFRGFVCAFGDERATESPGDANPYAKGRTAFFYDEGYLAGMREKRRIESFSRGARNVRPDVSRRKFSRRHP